MRSYFLWAAGVMLLLDLPMPAGIMLLFAGVSS